jgi:predicted small lipoprotein YifL
VQGLLQVDDNLTAVGKSERDHAARALVVNVGVGVVVQPIAAGLYARKQAFSMVQKFKVGHYNRCMLKVWKILVTVHALVGGAAMLTACGQKGPLFSPNTPESAGRATLPQALTPWRTQNTPRTPSQDASSKPETTAPVAPQK